MRLLNSLSVTTAILGGLGLLFAVVLAVELVPGSSTTDTGRSPQTSKKPSLPVVRHNEFNLPALQNYHEIIDRPLFVQTRRPVPAEKSAAALAGQPDASLNQISLSAVIVSPTQRIALFRNTADKKTMRVEEGKPLQGWLLKEVLAESVTLAREGQEQKFVLVRKTPDAAQLQALRAASQARKAQQQARARAAAQPSPPPGGGAPARAPHQPPNVPRGQPGMPPNVPPVPPAMGAPPAAVPVPPQAG